MLHYTPVCTRCCSLRARLLAVTTARCQYSPARVVPRYCRASLRCALSWLHSGGETCTGFDAAKVYSLIPRAVLPFTRRSYRRCCRFAHLLGLSIRAFWFLLPVQMTRAVMLCYGNTDGDTTTLPLTRYAHFGYRHNAPDLPSFMPSLFRAVTPHF